MAEKRDIQIVRLACRKRWLTAEEGEDLLFLKRKFGNKLTIEEIIRRRGYLDDAEIDELSKAAGDVGGRRAAPEAPSRRAEPARTPAAPPSASPPSAPMGRGLPPAARSSVSAPPARPQIPPAVSTGRVSINREATRFDPLPPAALRALRDEPPPEPEVEEEEEDDEPEAAAERTMIAPLPEMVRRERERRRDREAATVLNLSRDEILEAVRVAKEASDVDPEATFGEEENERTLFNVSVAEVLGKRPPVEPEARSYDEPMPSPDATLAIGDPKELLALRTRRLKETVERAHTMAFRREDLEAASQLVAVPRSAIERVDVEEEVTADEVPIVSVVDDADDEVELVELPLGPFGPYRLERIIARGRRSVVYLAEVPATGTRIALKVLGGDPESAARIVSAAGDDLLAAARIDSPHVVRVLDVGRVDGQFFVALEYVDGWSLEERLLFGERPSLHESMEIVREVALALAAADAEGIVHGDVTLSNVLVDADGHARLTGLGLSKSGRRGGPLEAGFLVPESTTGQPPTHQSDLYALGVLLFRLATGRMPVDATDEAELIARTLGEPAPHPKTIDPTIPDRVGDISQRLLRRRPEDRITTATEVAIEVEGILASLEAAGLLAAVEKRKAAFGRVAVRSAIALVLVLAPLVGLLLGMRALDASPWSLASWVVDGALFGAIGLGVATVLVSTLALIRRGEIPLPMSSAWLVRLQEGAGTLGALALLATIAMAPPAGLNVVVATIAVVVLGSILFGIVLRRHVAKAREDGGVGRMLAVLGDPQMSTWRFVHVPMLVALTFLATTRFALLAYFSAGGA